MRNFKLYGSVFFLMLLTSIGNMIFAQCPSGIFGGPAGFGSVVCSPSPAYNLTGGEPNSTWTIKQNGVVVGTSTGTSYSLGSISGNNIVVEVELVTPGCSQQTIGFNVKSASFSVIYGTGWYDVEFTENNASVSWSGPGIDWSDAGNSNVFYGICNSGSGTVTMTTSDGCTASQSISYTGVDATINGPSTVQCGSSATYTGTQNGGIGVFSVSPANAGSFSGNVFTADANYSGSATITYTVDYNYSTPKSGTNSMTCVATQNISITCAPPCNAVADAGSALFLDCNTSSGTIGSSPVSGYSYSWSPTSGLSNPTSASTSASPTTTTTYTLTVTDINDPNCTATDMVTVTVDNTLPMANAGSGGSIDCFNSTVSIGVSTGGGNSYSWSPTSGLSNPNDAVTNASPSATTTYTLTVTGTNGCSSTDVVTVVVDNTPPTANAGNDGSIDCFSSSVSIGVSTGVGNNYSWSPSTGLSNPNNAVTNASPTSSTTYTLTVIGTNGCVATDEVTVTVDNTPPVADAGFGGTVDCYTPSVTIGTFTGGSNSYFWTPSTGLSNPNTAVTDASPSSTTTYTLTVVGSNGCSSTDVVTVVVDNTPPTANAGNGGTLNCISTSLSIGVSTGVNNSYSWSPSTGLSNPNSAVTMASPSITTTYTLTVTGLNGCQATDEVTVVVDNTPPSVSITGNTTVCNSGATTITANGANTYLWSTNQNASSIVVGVGTYTVTGTASNGCTATSAVTITNVEGSVGNYVWNDVNANGLNDEATTFGLNNIMVELWSETAPGSGVYILNQTTFTNTQSGLPGYYNFVICESGNYKVKFPINIALNVLTQQTSTPGIDNNSDANVNDGFSPAFYIDVNGTGVAKDNNTIDAGYKNSKAKLGNYVWIDEDKDGVQDAGEVGVAGITVMLYNSLNQVVGSTTTDAYGYYIFNPIPPSTYYLGFTLPANYQFTNPNTTSDDLDSDVDNVTGLTGNYIISAGDSNMTIDAGIYFEAPETASLGNYVWFDTDEDGVQDANEQGISGVTVSLFNAANTIIATAITDANGFYQFTDLTPGVYSVGFTAPIGLVFSPNNGAVSLPSNSDANPTTGRTLNVVVNAGDEITYVDAGLFNQPTVNGGLGDRVWYDIDQDGIQDVNENGVRDVTVTLYDGTGNNTLAITSTDMYGNYMFNNLPAGTYMIGFSNLPGNYTLSPANVGTDSTVNSDADPVSGRTNPIYLSAGQYNITYDAGIFTTISANNNSIGNFVWNDLDKDGIQDAGEQGVSGITVSLFNNSNVLIANTATDVNGYYLFPNLPNGVYYVNFSNLPVGFVFSPQGVNTGTPSTDSDPNTSTGNTPTVSLTGNTHNMDLDAGVNLGNIRVGLATLGDRVWYDMNGNGLQDNTEAGVQGVTVTLFDSLGTTVISTTTTDALGNYIFTSLNAGSYVVGFTNLPVGYTISPLNADGQGINGEENSDVNPITQKTDNIALATGEDKMSVDMGLVPPVGSASLGNFVWFDLNNDGLQTSGEPGVQGISVTLYDAGSNAIATTSTNAEGEYYFVGLTPGTYSVGFSNLPSGYNFTTVNANGLGIDDPSNSDANPSTGLTTTVTLTVGQNNLNLDAGIMSSTVASVGDYVWFDQNQNGIQDPSEAQIGGVLATLYDAGNNPVSSTITRPNGFYIFTNVTPGTYTIGFTNIPTGLVFTFQEADPASNLGSNVIPSTGRTSAFTVVAGTHNPTIDAGLTNPINAGLGNYVWYDINENGLQDPTEPGIAGVAVTLYASDGITSLATAITDGSGAYSFPNLPAGSYVVGFAAPLGYTRTRNLGAINDATNSDILQSNKTNVVSLSAGEYNPNIDAGFYIGVPLPAKVLQATLVNFVNASLCTVNWFTKDEQNTLSFEIERGVDNQHFEKVGTHVAAGNSFGQTDYSFNDDLSSLSEFTTLYYRIKLVDIDGKISYSNVINVTKMANDEPILVYPNPFVDALTIELMSDVSDLMQLTLSDMNGRVISVLQKEVAEGMNKITIHNLGSLSLGNYYLKITSLENGYSYLRQLSK